MAKRQVKTKPDYIKWLLLAGAVSLGVLFGGYIVKHYIWSHSVLVDRFRYPVAGIDVSKHNGKIDFDKVRDDNYQFVFIKASEGKNHKDGAFNSNYKAARDAGLKVGAYHFFRKNRTGREQADNLLSVVKGKQLDLPLVIDLEDNWGNGATTGRDVAMHRLLEMITCLTDKGYQVMIYTNQDGYKKYYKDMLTDCDLWLCAFTSPEQLSDMGHCIQQYSHEGKVAGTEGDVDPNVFLGSKKQWQAYLDKVKQPTQ